MKYNIMLNADENDINNAIEKTKFTDIEEIMY